MECSVSVHPAISWTCTDGTLSGGVGVQTMNAGPEGQQYLFRTSPNFIDLHLDVKDRCDGDYLDGDYVGYTSC